MIPAKRTLSRRLRDHLRRRKPSTDPSGSEQAKSPVAGTDGRTAERSEDLVHPGKSTKTEEQLDIHVSGNRPSGTQIYASANEYRPAGADLGAENVLEKAVGGTMGQYTTTAAVNAPESAPLGHPEITQIPLCDVNSSIWLKSIERFKEERPEEHELMIGELDQIETLKDGDTWDTWLNRQHLDKASLETKYKWIRKFKAYMPSVAAVKGLAIGLSNLDPHKVAPLVTAGVFVIVELSFGLVDAKTRDTAMDLLLKTNIIINKWAFREDDLTRMKTSSESSMQKVNQTIEQIEERLDKLYFDGLVLMSLIYEAGRSRGGRVAASLVSGPPGWEQAYLKIQTKDLECESLKSQVESMLKNSKENIEILDWISNRKEDPEPLHQTVKERTGVDVTSAMVGNWFLEALEFSSWVDGICHNTAKSRIFWLKGSMGTGKTTLLCRVISEFENYPIDGVRIVPYYCYGSGSSPGPKYENILRALCRRLAWNSDGSVAEHAVQLYQSSKVDPEAQPTVKKTWEPLLQKLITSSSTTIVFVLDALDECAHLDDYTEILEYLHKMPRNVNGPYFLVSSRPHVPVGSYFNGSVHKFDVVQPETRDEMRKFIVNQIASRRERVRWKRSIFFKDPTLLEELESALLESAGGMFRWVEIWLAVFFPRNRRAVTGKMAAMELLKELKDPTTLGNLPQDRNDDSRDDKKKLPLKEAYEMLWAINGDGQDKDLQVLIFRIITASFKNLTPQALLEAVHFDQRYEDLDEYQVEELYSSFLKVNKQGCLEYEHLSAKTFVDQFEDCGKATFSSEESHRTMADIAVCAIEQPSHRVWIDADIDLVGRGPSPMASPRSPAPSPDLNMSKKWNKLQFKGSHWDSPLFGSYLFIFWLQHCQVLSRKEEFIRRMSDLFRRTPPSFQGWVLYQVEYSGLHYRNTLTRPADQGSEARQISPFFCMVSFGFSPISYIVDQPVLLQGFEDHTIRNLDGKAALHVACETTNFNVVEDLVKLEYTRQGWYSTLLSVKDHLGRTPLHLASDHDIAKMLLQYELRELRGSPASPTSTGPRRSQLLHVRDNHGKMAIEYIVRRGGDLITWILQEFLVEPQILHELLYNAVKSGSPGTVKLLLENGADPTINAEGHISALSLALLRNGSETDIAEMLLDHGARLEECNELKPTFDRAVTNVNLQMLDFLHGRGLSMDADYKVPGFTALRWAVISQRLDLIEFLLKRGANVHRTMGAAGVICPTVLHRAASKGNVKMAELLLDHGADVNASPANFSTPLASAVSHGNREMAEFLIDRGADAMLLSTSDKEALDTMIQR